MQSKTISLSLLAAALTIGGCTIQRIDDGGPFATRPVTVPAKDVAVYQRLEDVPGPYTVVEEVFVKDDGEALIRELESTLRVKAGARGANAIILAQTNRRPNGVRTNFEVGLDNPFDYYSATAIWVGEGRPPVKVIAQ